MEKNKLHIIDSECFDREIMNKIFGNTYEISASENVKGFINNIEANVIDVIYYEFRKANLSELKMFCQTIKTIDKIIPWIIVISENSIEIEQYARINNAFYCMIRPFNLKELWDVIEAATNKLEFI